MKKPTLTFDVFSKQIDVPDQKTGKKYVSWLTFWWVHGHKMFSLLHLGGPLYFTRLTGPEKWIRCFLLWFFLAMEFL